QDAQLLLGLALPDGKSAVLNIGELERLDPVLTPQVLLACHRGNSIPLFPRIAPQAELSRACSLCPMDGAGTSPCGRAEFVELLAVQRIWLHGLDALPNAPELGLRCPCGPSLRSGNPLAAARAEALRSCGLGPSAPRHPADLATGLPDRGRGRGTVAPPANGPALGALQL